MSAVELPPPPPLEAVEARQGGKLEAEQRSRAYLLFKWLDELIRDSRVLDPIEQLIGPDRAPWWSTIFCLQCGSEELRILAPGQHIDWGLSSRNVVTAWFAVSDAETLRQGA